MGKERTPSTWVQFLMSEKSPLKSHTSRACEIYVDRYLALMNTFITYWKWWQILCFNLCRPNILIFQTSHTFRFLFFATQRPSWVIVKRKKIIKVMMEIGEYLIISVIVDKECVITGSFYTILSHSLVSIHSTLGGVLNFV